MLNNLRLKDVIKQNQPDEAYILILDAYIHDRLREERQNELQQAAHDHSQYDLSEISLVFPDIAKEKPERTGIALSFVFPLLLVRVERRCWFKEHRDALVLTMAPCTYPVSLELVEIVFYQSFSWIGNIELLSSLDLVKHNEVVLVPVEDARKWRLR